MPAEDLRKILHETQAELAANTPANPETPAETPADPDETAPTEKSPAPETAENTETPDSPAAVADPAELSTEDFNFEEYKKADPKAAKAYQAALTKMRQKDAEKLKPYEGLDEHTTKLIKGVQQALREDPAQAAAWLEQQAHQIKQTLTPSTPAPAATPDPLANFVPTTDSEFYLAEALRQVQAQMAEKTAVVDNLAQRSQAEAYNARMTSEFNTLQTKAGRDLPDNERGIVHDYMIKNRLPNVETAFKVMYFDQSVREAAEKAAQKAASVVTRKANAAPGPGGVTPRDTGEPDEKPKTSKEMMRADLRKAGLS